MLTSPRHLLSTAICLLLTPIAPQAPGGAGAPASQAPSQAAGIAGIAHIAMRVGDLSASRAFYERLGFEEAFALGQSSAATEAFIKINDRQFIELYSRRSPAEPVAFMHVCYESPDLDGLNRLYRSEGLTPTDVRRAGAGNLLFSLRGPGQQVIEYTQYMPGSRHTNDRGQHLGAHRVAETILGVATGVEDPAAASAFYTGKMGFLPARSFAGNRAALALPGSTGEQVEFGEQATGTAFTLFFAVADLDRTTRQLGGLGLAAAEHGRTASIADPDGNRIVFVESRASLQ